MVFLFASVMNSVEVPQLLQSKFELNAQQLGLQFLGLIIGSLLGEQLGGFMSDIWMNRRARQIGRKPAPEFRLWLSYIGFLLTIAGMVVFLVCTEHATPGKWSVKPIVGTAIAAFGNQVVTTVMTTYAVDTHPEDAGSVGVFINVVRSTWGFIGPFWYVHLSFVLISREFLLTSLKVPLYVRKCRYCEQFWRSHGLSHGCKFLPYSLSAIPGKETSQLWVD